ncbi:MAG: ATP-binding cassette domain-containing protein [Chloroflexi bacterium]|mgnify:CR=1 FL=1|nr:ATP-binding cassette domain-containing protein [Chloroflexota bacterium]
MKIEIQGINKSFGAVQANADVSVTVASGTIHGLLGENGAGKTTLMRILSGYLQADSGEIRVDGGRLELHSPADAIGQGIGMLHQDPLDVPALSVLDNFALGLHRGFWQRRGRIQRTFFNLCRRFGVQLQPEDRVGNLTVGERQQLELVRLLALGVRVVILDEPTTGISEPQKRLLFETLHRLAEEGLTVIFVSHKLEDVEMLCSVATVLRAGQVVGELRAPFDRERLVEMMFGRAVVAPPFASRCTTREALDIQSLVVESSRMRMAPASLKACAGEVIGLAGLEGSGQRLFMEACAGIRKAQSGHLVIDGVDLTNGRYRDYLDQGVAYVPASRLEEGLVRGLSVREHFVLARQRAGFLVDWEAAEQVASARIAEYSVVGTTGSRVEELSGGNQQRALLSLLPDSLKLLILDHPTRGLDLGSGIWVWQQLHERCLQGTVILFASTDLDELVDNSDRLLVFSGGKVSQPVASAEMSREELGFMIGGVNL